MRRIARIMLAGAIAALALAGPAAAQDKPLKFGYTNQGWSPILLM